MSRLTTRKMILFGIALLSLPMLYLGAFSAADEPDDDERAYQLAVARQALRENCLICHTHEMIANQRLTPVQWKAEVTKMVDWGSPLPPDRVQPLIDYLSEEFSTNKPAGKLARMTYAHALSTVRPEVPPNAPVRGSADRGAALYKTHCSQCHGPEGQGAELGPNLVEKPVLLRPRDFDTVICQGRGRMPGFQKLLGQAQTDDMLAWLRERRYVPPSR